MAHRCMGHCCAGHGSVGRTSPCETLLWGVTGVRDTAVSGGHEGHHCASLCSVGHGVRTTLVQDITVQGHTCGSPAVRDTVPAVQDILIQNIAAWDIACCPAMRIPWETPITWQDTPGTRSRPSCCCPRTPNFRRQLCRCPTGQGWTGQGRTGQGRTGQGRAGQDRPPPAPARPARPAPLRWVPAAAAAHSGGGARTSGRRGGDRSGGDRCGCGQCG